MTYLKDVAEYEVTQADAEQLVETGLLEIEDDRGRIKATVEVEDIEVEADPEPEEITEEADAPIDPSDHTISELEEALDDGDFTEDELQAVVDAEEAGKDRDGALEALASAIGAVRTEE